MHEKTPISYDNSYNYEAIVKAEDYIYIIIGVLRHSRMQEKKEITCNVISMKYLMCHRDLANAIKFSINIFKLYIYNLVLQLL